MPWADCPACKAEVKYRKDADVGTTVKCPDCDEVFVPPGLKPRLKAEAAYDPEDEDTYDAKKAIEDPDRARKKKHAQAAAHHAREMRKRERQSARPSFFGGPEVVLLIFSVLFLVTMPILFGFAKRNPSKAEGGAIILAMCGLMAIFGWRIIKFKSRVGG